MPTYESIIDIQVADLEIKAAAIRHAETEQEGYGDFIILGRYDIWNIVARAIYNPLRKDFIYDGGVELYNGGWTDRQGGYKTLTELIEAAKLKAEKEYLDAFGE